MGEWLRITMPVFGVGALAFWWAGRRVAADVRRARWIKFATYVVIVHAVLLATVLGRVAICALVASISAIGLWEIVSLLPRLRRSVWLVAVLAFAAIAAGAIRFSILVATSCVGYVYVVVAVFDGFSQASGQIVGRVKLAPAISPGKTVEGFAVGASAAIGCAMLLRSLARLTLGEAAVVGVVVAVAGLVGDLAASWVKRRAGVKDYGTLLPGHGGVLDRFDSFLTVAAVLSIVAAYVW
jgi:phosphatidate cytidylyltransferase